MHYTNDLTVEYENTRDSLKPTYSEAYEFLIWIEGLLEKGFHLGTAINLHLYHQNKFLFYFRKDSATQITISSKPNVHIKQGTHVDNKSFFMLWMNLMKNMKLEKSKVLKIIQKNDFVVTITKSADSPRLFELLSKVIRMVQQSKKH